MIGTVRERREFDRLQREGRRARTDALWCRYLADPTVAPPAVGFAIGRSVGTAVARNRLRRRLRALVRARAGTDLLPFGILLVGASPGATERSFATLGADLDTLLRIAVTT